MTEPLLFELSTAHVASSDLRVVSLDAEEEVNGAFSARVLVSSPADATYLGDLEASMLGQLAALAIHAGGARRRLHGTVSSFRVLGPTEGTSMGERARIELEIVPRLALLALRRQSRIFQEKTIPEIVTTLLGDWKIAHTMRLVAAYKPRPYVTQHGETDLDFLRRILAVEGIGFYFAASAADASINDAPEVIFFDATSGYSPVAVTMGDPERVPQTPPGARGSSGARGGKAAVLRHGHGNFTLADDVFDFTLHRKLAAKSASLGDFDFRRPQGGFQAVSHYGTRAAGGPSAIEQADRFEAFFYDDRQEYESTAGHPPNSGDPGRVPQGPPEIDDDRAMIALEQLRRDATTGEGRTRSSALIPGHVFTLEGHLVEALNQDYVVTRVAHRGRITDVHGGDSSYEAVFTTAPAHVTCRPPIERGARAVRGAETAIVVGPKGEDIYTDALGRVKVRFHWDLHGKGDEHSSCWLRVAEAWAGQRWGTQFVPRVGMEVLVTFLGGDVDRPLVTGCLYNATHPTPFRLPEDKHRTGLRTQSSDGSGFNELSFQDLAGEEQVLLHARRDLDVTVGRDSSRDVGGDERQTIAGSLAVTVEGGYTADVGGVHSMKVAGASVLAVSGNQTVTVNGTRNESVSGGANLNIAGDLVAVVAGGAKPQVGGGAELKLSGDAVLRAEGHLVTVVGKADARTSATIHVQGGAEIYSAAVTEIIAETAIVLRVGETQVKITTDTVEIDAEHIVINGRKDVRVTAGETFTVRSEKQGSVEAGTKLELEGQSASVRLTTDARIDGDVVKLNCAPEPADKSADAAKPRKPTTFVLVDQEGKPMPGQRLTVTEADGTERSAVLDAQGQAKLDLDASGDVVFSDVGSTTKKS